VIQNLELIRDFVNTRELDGDDDVERLESGVAVRDWLSERGLLAPSARVSAEDRARTLAVRETIRADLLRNNGVDIQVDHAPLEQAARRACLELRFGDDGTPTLEPRAGGVDGALGRIVATIAAAHGDGSWERLKACRADDCLWAFVDHARNRSRSWCSMRSCGNRAKIRAYRERHATV
jgi:predicted RNA-binding Zn ribbon-like protein